MSALPMQIVINHLVVFSINLGELIQVVSRIKMMGGFLLLRLGLSKPMFH